MLNYCEKMTNFRFQFRVRGKNEKSVVAAAVIGGNTDVLATILDYYIIDDNVTIQIEVEPTKRSTKVLATILDCYIIDDNVTIQIEVEPTKRSKSTKDDTVNTDTKPNGTTMRSPLSYAASKGNIQMVSHLLTRDDPNTSHKRDPNSTTGKFPIHIAAATGRKAVLEKIFFIVPCSLEVLTWNEYNILHMAAHNGRDDMVRYILGTPGSDGLINAGDDKGNTPLHCAVIAKYPKAVDALTWDERVILDLVNDDGKTALDLALINDGGEVPSLKQKLACLALIYAGAPEEKLQPDKGSTKATTAFYKDRVNTLTVVATLVTTVSFAAGFTMPGGNSGTDPTLGTANFLNKPIFKVFMISDSIALYTSVLDVLVLILAMRGDAQLLHFSLNIAVPLLGISLAAMSVSFMSASYLVISTLRWLGVVVWLLGSLFLLAAATVFLLIFLALFGKNSFTRYLIYPLFRALLYISERENVRNDHFL